MSVGWSGADPVDFSDGGSATYELGTEFTAASDVTVNNIRVWGHSASASRANRAAKVWSNGGSLLASAALPDTLLAGWHTYALDAAVPVSSGTTIVVSYDVTDTYGANTSPGYPRASSDTLVTAVRGRRDLTTPDVFPTGTTTGVFYGIDIDYEAGIGGNQRPTVGISVTATDLDATATLTIDDESPSTVTYVIEWGDGSSDLGLTGLGPHAHTYTTAGRYAVLVTATDNGGLTDCAAAVVEVFAVGPMDLAVIMAEVAARLDTIAGLRCFAWPPGTATPPAAVVGYPTEYRYDETYGRGMDRMTLPVVVLVDGKPTDRKARDRLAAYVNGSGSSSIKAVLESGVYTALDTLRVTGVEVDVYQLAAVEYLAAIFDIDIAGQGSA